MKYQNEFPAQKFVTRLKLNNTTNKEQRQYATDKLTSTTKSKCVAAMLMAL